MSSSIAIIPSANRNPNLPQGTRYVQLPPVTLVPASAMSNALVVDGLIDTDRLAHAIAELGGWLPVIAGRYVSRPRPETDLSDFAIELTGSPIALEVDETTSSEYPFPSRAVVQPSLEPFVPSLPPSFAHPDSGAPLISFRLTTSGAGKYSVIGMSISHTLADGASCSKILRDLSFLYTTPGQALPAPPSFFNKVTYPAWPPTSETLENWRLPLLDPLPMSEIYAKFGKDMEESDPVLVYLSVSEVQAIVKEAKGGADGHLSDQDAVTGWWISVLERVGENPIQVVRYAINYRTMYKTHPAFPPGLKTQFTTTAQMREITLPSAAFASPVQRAQGVARAVRAEIERLKGDPEAGAEWLSNAAYWHEKAAEEDKAHDYTCAPGVAIVNSNMRYDWTPKFGFEKSCYHTLISLRRFLRVFQANPEVGGDPDGTIELAFNVEKGKTDKLYEIVAEDRQRWSL